MTGRFTPDEREKLHAWEAPEVPEGFLERVMAAAEDVPAGTESLADAYSANPVGPGHRAPEAQPAPSRRSAPMWLWAVAAAMLAGVLTVALWGSGTPDEPVQPAVVVPTHPAVEAAWVAVETARLEATDARPVELSPTPEPPTPEPTERSPLIIGE